MNANSCSNGGGDFEETTMGEIELKVSALEETRTSINFAVCTDNIIENTESFQITFSIVEKESDVSLPITNEFVVASANATVMINDTSRKQDPL